MTKAERLIKMLLQLLHHEKMPSKGFAEQFQVSTRTVLRDMAALKEMGIPVEAYQGYEGGFRIPDHYKLDRHLLTEAEQLLVVRALRSLSKMVDDPTLETIINKLSHFHGIKETSAQPLWLEMSPWETEKGYEKAIAVIKGAILANKRIGFHYSDVYGVCSERVIDPLQVVFKGYGWYVYGYCHLRKENRLFRVSRMKHLVRLNENAYTVFEGHVPFDSRERISEPIRIRGHVSHVMQIDLPLAFDDLPLDDEGYFVTTLNLPLDQWVVDFFVSLGAVVEVLSPEHLRQDIQNRLEMALKNYQLSKGT